jgi:hypothetical protein
VFAISFAMKTNEDIGEDEGEDRGEDAGIEAGIQVSNDSFILSVLCEEFLVKFEVKSVKSRKLIL